MRFRFSDISLFPVILAISGFLMILIGTSRYGIGLSPDSVSYIYCARQLAAGEGFQSFNNNVFSDWPPLYPVVLSLSGLFGLDPVVGARWINAVLFAILIFAAHRLFQIYLKENFPVVLGTISAVFCMHLVFVAIMAWSETLFILMVVLLCIQLNHLVLKPSRKSLFWAVLWTSLAALTRYAGVVLIISGALVILLLQENSLKERLKQALLYCVVSSIPIFLWMLRNTWLDGGFAGHRPPATISLAEIINWMLIAFSRWTAPPRVPFAWRLTIMIILAGVLGWSISKLWLNRSFAKTELRQLGVLVIVFMLYTIFIMVTSMITILDRPYRFLSVMFIPAVCMTFGLIFQTNPKFRETKIRWWLSRCICILWSSFSLLTLYAFLQVTLWNGAGGYSTLIWQHSPILHYLKSHPLQGIVYTNGADALYILNQQKGRSSPNHDELGPAWFPDIKGNVPHYLVWFKSLNWRSYLANPDQLGIHYKLVPYKQFPDGTIYEVKQGR